MREAHTYIERKGEDRKREGNATGLTSFTNDWLAWPVRFGWTNTCTTSVMESITR